MTEAALWQIIYRAKNFTKEGVPNISEADRLEIEGTEITSFNNLINVLHLNERYPRPEGLERMVDELEVPSP